MKIAIAILMLAAISATAQDATMPPAGAVKKEAALGVGVQIYSCTAAGTWVLQEPQADLLDPETKKALGTHTKGPIWTWNDGSIILGKVIAQKPSETSIPWLLLSVESTGAHGTLSDIRYVRRSETQGGKIPESAICGSNNIDSLLKVPYAATYTFYTAK